MGKLCDLLTSMQNEGVLVNRKQRREQQQERRRGARTFQTALRAVFPTAKVELSESGLAVKGPTGMQSSAQFKRIAGRYGVTHG